MVVEGSHEALTDETVGLSSLQYIAKKGKCA